MSISCRHADEGLLGLQELQAHMIMAHMLMQGSLACSAQFAILLRHSRYLGNLETVAFKADAAI